MNIKQSIFHSFGYNLTDEEVKKLIHWYEIEGQYKSKRELYSAIRAFLVETFPKRIIYIREEDTSDITLLLAALNNEIKRQKNE